MDDYGLWLLAGVNSAIFIAFALSFFHPRTERDWEAMGGFSSFVVALLAIQEERIVAARFGAAWDDYASRTPRFLPHLGRTGAGRQPLTPRPRS